MAGDAVTSLPWHVARDVARSIAKPLEVVESPLHLARGASLAEPLRALAAMPAYTNSAMDGYAVAGSGPWIVVGTAKVGSRPGLGPLRPGEAMEIATGAPTPLGTDAVLPIEHSSRDGSLIRGEVIRGRNVRRAGEDADLGAELLPVGTLVSDAVLGLAASIGHDALLVHRMPTVSAVVTGDEVQDAGRPEPGRVRDAIGPMLPGLVTAAGGRLQAMTLQADVSALLLNAVVADRSDVLVVCGGTSTGPADHLRSVLRRLDAELLVDTVACRPGHPQLLEILPDGRHVVGLPGNPFAALVAAHTLLIPLLRVLAGRRVTRKVTATWGDGMSAHPTHTRLVPVSVEDGCAVPVGHDRSGTLRGVALSDALAVLPPQQLVDEVELLYLP